MWTSLAVGMALLVLFVLILRFDDIALSEGSLALRLRLNDVPHHLRIHPLHVVTALWVGSFLAGAPRAAAPWGWAALGLALRAWWGPHLLMGVGYPYARHATATQAISANPLYGEGWGAFVAPFMAIAPPSLHALWTLNMVLGALTIVAIWRIAHALSGPQAAHVSAAAITLLPWHIWLSTTESMFVACALWLAAGCAGALGDRRSDALLAATSFMLAAHGRPLLLLAATVGCVWMAARARHTGHRAHQLIGAVTALAIGLRVLFLLQSPILFQAHASGGPWIAHDVRVLALLDPFRMPIALSLLVAWRAQHLPRRALWVAAITLAAWVVFWRFGRMTDITRMQLVAATLSCALVGPAWQSLPPPHRKGWAMAMVISWAVAYQPIDQGGGTWTHEHRALVRAMHDLAPGHRIHVARPFTSPNPATATQDEQRFHAWTTRDPRLSASREDAYGLWVSRTDPVPAHARWLWGPVSLPPLGFTVEPDCAAPCQVGIIAP